MRTLLRRVGAFVVRDFRSETSYRLYFTLQLLGTAWTVVLFWFVSRLVGPDVPALAPYGGDWFAFVVVAYAPMEFLRVGVLGFSSRLRQAQEHGTLEALLVSRAGIPTIVFGSVAYPYIWATFRALVFLAIGTTAAGTASHANLPAVAVFLLLAIVAFGAIGVLSASFVMVFKKGEPVSMLLLGTSTLFAGLFFPVKVLGALEVVSKALPPTYAMEGIRLAVLSGAGLDELWPTACVLAAFCAVLVPAAAWSFRLGMARARRDGTLSHY